MSEPNGGPAFSHDADYVRKEGGGYEFEVDFHPGMSLLVWLAASMNMDWDSELPTFSDAQRLVGRECPDRTKNILGHLQFWADAKAKVRFINARAMLAESERQGE